MLHLREWVGTPPAHCAVMLCCVSYDVAAYYHINLFSSAQALHLEEGTRDSRQE
jgi:hypothetical protein